MNAKRKTALVSLTSLMILLLTGAWSVLAGDGWAPEPWSDLSLEGIWTTMTPTPAGSSAILSLVIDAQGSEGMVYTCVGKHPECSVTAYGLSPEAEKVSDLLGYLVRTAANTFRFSVVCQGIKGTGPEPGSNFSYSANLTEIILLGVLAQRFNTRIEWDAKNARITNHPELNAYIKEPVRKGFEYGESL